VETSLRGKVKSQWPSPKVLLELVRKVNQLKQTKKSLGMDYDQSQFLNLLGASRKMESLTLTARLLKQLLDKHQM
jgi:hypothetical protein